MKGNFELFLYLEMNRSLFITIENLCITNADCFYTIFPVWRLSHFIQNSREENLILK